MILFLTFLFFITSEMTNPRQALEENLKSMEEKVDNVKQSFYYFYIIFVVVGAILCYYFKNLK